MVTLNRILIVDDHVLFRDALRDLLEEEPDFQIVGEAGNLREAIQSVGSLSPHLVLTDLGMPDAHGIEAVTEMKRHFPNLKILVLSFHSESEYKSQCRNAGAAGYIMKDAIKDELRKGVRAILSGKTYYVDFDEAEETASELIAKSAARARAPSYSLH